MRCPECNYHMTYVKEDEEYYCPLCDTYYPLNQLSLAPNYEDLLEDDDDMDFEEDDEENISNRINARNWSVICKDDTGAFVMVEYKCPYCKMVSNDLVGVNPPNSDTLEYGFEMDRTCSICGHNLIVECN